MTATDLAWLQIRVIGALVLRETRASFGTSQIGYLWAIVTPAAGVTLLVFLFSLVDRQPPLGQSLALFFATGILTLEFFNKMSSQLMTAFDANRALLTYPVIREVDALIARAILISATYLVIMALFFGGLMAAGLAVAPPRPEVVFCAWFATALFGLGFGAVNAVILSHWESWAQIEKVLTRPLFFISGIFFIPGMLPAEVQDLLWWNPILHLVEWMREGFYHGYDSPLLSPGYPLGLSLALLLVALGAERLFRRRRS